MANVAFIYKIFSLLGIDHIFHFAEHIIANISVSPLLF